MRNRSTLRCQPRASIWAEAVATQEEPVCALPLAKTSVPAAQWCTLAPLKIALELVEIVKVRLANTIGYVYSHPIF